MKIIFNNRCAICNHKLKDTKLSTKIVSIRFCEKCTDMIANSLADRLNYYETHSEQLRKVLDCSK